MGERRFGNLVFRPDDGRLQHALSGASEHLRPKTARLLECLLDHAGDVVARDTIIERVWDSASVVDFDAGLAALLRELRQALDSVGESASLVETVPRRGYRINASVGKTNATPRRIVPWARVLAAAVMALGIVLGTRFALFQSEGQRETTDAALSLAILPFEVFGRSEGMPEHLDLLLADTLLAELVSRPLEGMDLIGRTSLRAYLDRDDVAAAAASDLGVDLLIEGSVLAQAPGEWRVEMRLLAVPPGRVAWSTSVRGEANQTMNVLLIARSLGTELAEAWPSLREELSARR